MSNARSPRDVCSTTIGISAITNQEAVSSRQEAEKTLCCFILTSDSRLLTPAFLPPTRRRSRSHSRLKNPALCDCAICQRCYVRPLALSRYLALVLPTVLRPLRSH